jgi:hypothetical protein
LQVLEVLVVGLTRLLPLLAEQEGFPAVVVVAEVHLLLVEQPQQVQQAARA